MSILAKVAVTARGQNVRVLRGSMPCNQACWYTDPVGERSWLLNWADHSACQSHTPA